MAFNLFNYILKKTGAETMSPFLEDPSTNFDEEVRNGLAVYLQRIAFWSCVRRIGSTMAAVDWDVYRRGKKVKSSEFWSWNYDPNPNQTKAEFFMRLVAQLYTEQDAIIVETGNGYRYVAESFSREKKLSGNIYTDIRSDGQTIPGTFTARDVLHLSIEGDSIRQMLGGLAMVENQLMNSATTKYKRDTGMRGVLKVDEIAEADGDFEDTYADLINDKFKKYFTSDNAVLPLFNGYEYEDKSEGGSGATTRDIRAMMDDILEITAQAFGMPASVAFGAGVTEADFQSFMTAIIQPLAKMFSEELNRKLYNRSLVVDGTCITPNYSGVKYNDLFDIADPIDKLIGSGAFCVNDIRARLGASIIDEEWAWQHWMTKNYSPADDLIDGMADGKPLGNPRDDPENPEPDKEEEGGNNE